MKNLNENGNDGPTLIKIFSCEKCRFLGNAAIGLYFSPYKCLHNDVIKNNRTSFDLSKGDISKDKITPDFCPYIFKKERYEKLIELKKRNNDGN